MAHGQLNRDKNDGNIHRIDWKRKEPKSLLYATHEPHSMDHDDYMTFSECTFYEILKDGDVWMMVFDRGRLRDTRWEGVLHQPIDRKDFVYQFMTTERTKTEIWKEETEAIIEGFMDGSTHLPFGFTDTSTRPGKYWMYHGEMGITDPIPPLVDRIGIREWTIHTDSGEDETFRGDIVLAMRKLTDAGMSEAVKVLDRTLFKDKKPEEGKGPGGRRAWICIDNCPNLSITTELEGLAFWEDGRREGWLSKEDICTFKQRDGQKGL